MQAALVIVTPVYVVGFMFRRDADVAAAAAAAAADDDDDDAFVANAVVSNASTRQDLYNDLPPRYVHIYNWEWTSRETITSYKTFRIARFSVHNSHCACMKRFTTDLCLLSLIIFCHFIVNKRFFMANFYANYIYTTRQICEHAKNTNHAVETEKVRERLAGLTLSAWSV